MFVRFVLESNVSNGSPMVSFLDATTLTPAPFNPDLPMEPVPVKFGFYVPDQPVPIAYSKLTKIIPTSNTKKNNKCGV